MTRKILVSYFIRTINLLNYNYYLFRENLFLGILEFIRECSFFIKLTTIIITVFIVISVAYKINSKKDKTKISQKRSKTK